MIYLSDPVLADPVACPYLPERSFVQEYFFAYDLSAREFGQLLEKGWRRFGLFFFRPQCSGCRECRPIRVDVENFQPTGGQKRVLRRNRATEVVLGSLRYRQAIYQLYRSHTLARFDQGPEEERSFAESFFVPAVPAVQTEYYRFLAEEPAGKNCLCGTGWLDISEEAVSSVYYVFDPAWSRLSLGTFSILWEMDWARRQGLKWYYLGYWIAGNPSMAYKGQFSPCQLFDWDQGRWEPKV